MLAFWREFNVHVTLLTECSIMRNGIDFNWSSRLRILHFSIFPPTVIPWLSFVFLAYLFTFSNIGNIIRCSKIVVIQALLEFPFFDWLTETFTYLYIYINIHITALWSVRSALLTFQRIQINFEFKIKKNTQNSFFRANCLIYYAGDKTLKTFFILKFYCNENEIWKKEPIR